MLMPYRYNICLVFYYITLMVLCLDGSSLGLHLPPQMLRRADLPDKPHRAPAQCAW